MFERFTEQARQVVILAQEEARALEHNYIGSEHILLGLLRADDGIAGQALATLGIGIEDARADVVRITAAGSDVVSSRHIPFTPRAKKVLELALRDALALGHNYIGAEHILLGLVRENDGVAVHVLRDAGLGPEAVRDEVLRRLGESQLVAGRVVFEDSSDPRNTPENALDRRIEAMSLRERLMTTRLQKLRDELTELRAERERMDDPGEPQEQQ